MQEQQYYKTNLTDQRGTVEETQLEGEQANVSRLDFRTSKVKRCLKHFFGRVVETKLPPFSRPRSGAERVEMKERDKLLSAPFEGPRRKKTYSPKLRRRLNHPTEKYPLNSHVYEQLLPSLFA